MSAAPTMKFLKTDSVMQNKRKPSAQKPKQTVEGYKFPLNNTNFIIIAAAIVMIVVGFILISGGATTDGSYNPEIFNTTRIVVGPTLTFLGFIAVGVGIMWGKSGKTDLDETLTDGHD